MIEITMGEPQPVECSVCASKKGYQISDRVKKYYTTVINNEGFFVRGFYGESEEVITLYKTPYCANCGSKLKFKVKRTLNEVILKKA